MPRGRARRRPRDARSEVIRLASSRLPAYSDPLPMRERLRRAMIELCGVPTILLTDGRVPGARSRTTLDMITAGSHCSWSSCSTLLAMRRYDMERRGWFGMSGGRTAAVDEGDEVLPRRPRLWTSGHGAIRRRLCARQATRLRIHAVARISAPSLRTTAVEAANSVSVRQFRRPWQPVGLVPALAGSGRRGDRTAQGPGPQGRPHGRRLGWRQNAAPQTEGQAPA